MSETNDIDRDIAISDLIDKLHLQEIEFLDLLDKHTYGGADK